VCFSLVFKLLKQKLEVDIFLYYAILNDKSIYIELFMSSYGQVIDDMVIYDSMVTVGPFLKANP
jgi:hypothetical protein